MVKLLHRRPQRKSKDENSDENKTKKIINNISPGKGNGISPIKGLSPVTRTTQNRIVSGTMNKIFSSASYKKTLERMRNKRDRRDLVLTFTTYILIALVIVSLLNQFIVHRKLISSYLRNEMDIHMVEGPLLRQTPMDRLPRNSRGWFPASRTTAQPRVMPIKTKSQTSSLSFSSAHSNDIEYINMREVVNSMTIHPDNHTFDDSSDESRNALDEGVGQDAVIEAMLRGEEQKKVDKNANDGWTQGFAIKPTFVNSYYPLQIVIVPHSHCDPGWIKTFDEYFQSQTKHILTNVVNALNKNPRRSFIWAEISYFEWWYRDQNDEMKKIAKKLLQNKQLEFVTGGWVQPDEANTQLYGIEVQFQEGHDWINQTFGEQYIPKYGWSIDPFGYSDTMPYLLKKYKFKGMVIQRVHYSIKKYLAERQQLEFIWRQKWENHTATNREESQEHDILCHLEPFYSYDIPHTCGPTPSVCCQFDFARWPVTSGDKSCPWGDDPIEITNENVAKRAMVLLNQYKKKAALYRTNTLMVPLGDDFRYLDADEATNQFKNYEKIFDYLNKEVKGVNIRWGTLSDYFGAIQDGVLSYGSSTENDKSKNTNINGNNFFPVLTGSFFTYADRERDYWSGYFTSRVFDKSLDRQLERILYAAESMDATRKDLQNPRRALSLFQHHDGITGTATDHVVGDYAKRIMDSIHETESWIVKNVINNKHQHLVQKVLSSQKKLQGEQNNDGIKVVEDSDIQPCWVSYTPRGMTKNLCGDSATVIAYNPLSTNQICMVVDENEEMRPQHIAGNEMTTVKLPCELSVPIEGTELGFDHQSGLMQYPIKEQWMLWTVEKGGAYLFFPKKLKKFNAHEHSNVTKRGYVVDAESWKRTTIPQPIPNEFMESINYNDVQIWDFEYEINLQKGDREWFVRFTTNPESSFHIGNNKYHKFITDLNGFNYEVHNFRKFDMPIQSQVYPMSNYVCIEDDKARMTIYSTHAQGATSMSPNSIDIFLDRRLLGDDARGLGQGVLDNVPTRTRLRVLLERNIKNHHYSNDDEFEMTPLGKHVWEQLNHPLVFFGKHTVKAPTKPPKAPLGKIDSDGEKSGSFLNTTKRSDDSGSIGGGLFGFLSNAEHALEDSFSLARNALFGGSKNGKHKVTVPFVYMVNKRVELFRRAIVSLVASDFPKDGSVPLIISQDGSSIPEEMQHYIDEIKTIFPNVIHLTHPYSCNDHPDTFPGDDPSLNDNYPGDTYGNKRDWRSTCCKHHFTWLLKSVFNNQKEIDYFFFIEEDYTVATTIYESIQTGIMLMNNENHHGGRDEIFAVTLDPSEAYTKQVRFNTPNKWQVRTFVSGPMVLSRTMFTKLQKYAKQYCTVDEYNWDWSIIHLQGKDLLPFKVLVTSQMQVLHIGNEKGMHEDNIFKEVDQSVIDIRKQLLKEIHLEEFHGTVIDTTVGEADKQIHDKGYGGWGNRADQDHCYYLLSQMI